MKKSMKYAVAFLALAGAASTTAYAADRDGRHGPRAQMNFDRADADSSGDVTFEEFAAAMQSRMGAADVDKDGKMTVEEIADEIVRMRAVRQAERMIKRFDTDGDGALTTAEIEARQKKMFALLDRNDDGKLVQDEMPRRGDRHGWRRGQH
jgi:Ca2+-binding EF-hand superfamily protein